MSVSPGQYNINLQRRADFYLQLQFKDSGGVPIDLTGWAVYAQIWDKGRTANTPTSPLSTSIAHSAS